MTKLLGYDAGIRIRFDGKSALAGLDKTRKSFLSLKRVILTTLAGKVVRDMAQFGRDFGIMADRTGMSVQKLSGLRNAFISAGSGAKGFERTINNINDGLQGLAMGSGEQAAKLAMFGVSPYTAGGRLKQPDEILYGLADWAKKQKGRLSKEQILYRFRTLLNIDDELGKKLLDGAESFKRFRDEASKRMGEIDRGTQRKLDDVKTKWDELGGAVTNTSAKVVAEFQGPLSGVLNWTRELVKLAGEFPKTTGAVVGGVGVLAGLPVFMRTIAGLANLLVGTKFAAATAALLGLKLALGGLALALGGLAGYGLVKLLDWFGLFDWIAKKVGTKDELAMYKNPDGKIDYESLQYWFDSGAINPQKNKEEYKQALHVLHAYNPDKYQNLYADMMTDPEFKHKDGFSLNNTSDIMKRYSLPLGIGYDVARAALTGGGNPITQSFEFTVMGNMDRDVAQQTMTMAKDAKNGLVPAGGVAR